VKKWFVFFFISSFLIVDGTNTYADNHGLLDKVRESTESNNGLTKIEVKADAAGAKIIKSIRRVGITVAVIMFALIGFSLWGAGGNPQAIMAAKGRVTFFFIGLFCVFGAEWIVGTFLSFIDPTALD
jgi:hypothetical protein